MPIFQFELTTIHTPGFKKEQKQFIEINYTAHQTISGIGNSFSISIDKISLTPTQLSALNYSNKLFTEIFRAARDHANNKDTIGSVGAPTV